MVIKLLIVHINFLKRSIRFVLSILSNNIITIINILAFLLSINYITLQLAHTLINFIKTIKQVILP